MKSPSPPYGHFLRQVQPKRIGAEAIGGVERIDDVAERLAHPLALDNTPSRGRTPAPAAATRALISIAGQITQWKRVMSLPMMCRLAGHQFAEQLVVPAVADRRGVVDQRVEPHVDDARRIERQRNAPRLPGAAHRNVFEAGFDETQDLVAADFRLDERRVRRVVLEQRLLILREAEEPVLLANPLRLDRRMDRTVPVDEVLLLLERLAADAVPAFVRRPRRCRRRRRQACAIRCTAGKCRRAVGGADEVVVRQVEALPDAA